MATWKDGPEYAPRERPAGYDVPDVAPLDVPTPAVAVPDIPRQAPISYEVVADQPALAAVAILNRHPRDPAEPFDTVSAAVAPGGPHGAWDATHAAAGGSARGGFDPRAPLLVADRGLTRTGQITATAPVDSSWAPPTGAPSFPAPGTLEWFAPARPPAPLPPARVGFGAWLTAVTPLVLAAFLAGIVLSFFAPVAGIAYLVGYAGTFLIRHRGGPIRVVATALLGIQLFSVFWAMAADQATVLSVCRLWNPVAAICCGLEVALAAILVRRSLRLRERPA